METGAFFIDGWRWLDEAVILGVPLECVLAAPEAARTPAEADLLARARTAAREFHEASPAQLCRLTGSVSSPGVAALVVWRPTALDQVIASLPPKDPALVLALDVVADPGNAGTLIRTADWFGLAAVVFGAGSTEPANPKLVRATMGSLFRVPIAATASLPVALALLRDAGFAAVGAALDGVDLAAFRWPARAVLVVGNEAAGIQPDVAAALDHRVRITAHGRAESLNAAVAGAILMHDWRRAIGA